MWNVSIDNFIFTENFVLGRLNIVIFIENFVYFIEKKRKEKITQCNYHIFWIAITKKKRQYSLLRRMFEQLPRVGNEIYKF